MIAWINGELQSKYIIPDGIKTFWPLTHLSFVTMSQVQKPQTPKIRSQVDLHVIRLILSKIHNTDMVWKLHLLEKVFFWLTAFCFNFRQLNQLMDQLC